MLVLFLWATALQASPQVDEGARVGAHEKGFSLEELRTRYGSYEDRYLTINDMEIAYRDEGTGPAILLIHGSSSNLRSLDAVAERLREKFRVVRYDVPPFGLSGPIDKVDLSNVDPSDIPALLLARLGIERATVVGTSFGGSIALNLASRHPDLVERLVISNSPSDPIGSEVKVGPSLTHAMTRYGTGRDRIRPYDYWRTNLEYFYGEPQRLSRETIRIATDFERILPERNLLAMISKTADNAATREAYAKVEGPVLLLWGGRDPMLPAPTAARLATYLPKAEISTIIMPDVGHYPLMEVPQRYAGLVEAYIRLATPLEPVSPSPNER